MKKELTAEQVAMIAKAKKDITEAIAELEADLETPALCRQNTIVMDADFHRLTLGVDEHNHACSNFSIRPVRFRKEYAEELTRRVVSTRTDGSRVKWVTINEADWMRLRIKEMREGLAIWESYE